LAIGGCAAEDEGVAARDDLEAPERLLWLAHAGGAWVDLRPRGAGGAGGADALGAAGWGPDRVIRAEVIRALLLGAGPGEPGAAPAVRLRGARITGRLDLMGATVSCPLVCEYCFFEEELRFVEASTRTVRIVRSALPGLNGTRMRLDGILNLWACEISGVLRLDQARIAGELCVREAAVRRPDGGTAGGVAGGPAEPAVLSCDGMAVEGGVDAAGLTVRGPASARVATISGSLNLSGARFTSPRQRALVLSNAVIGGKVDCGGLAVEGELRMHNARFAATMILAGARLDNPGGVALSAGGLSIDGGIFLTEDFAAVGEIRMVGARLGANLSLAGASLTNPGGLALDLNRATIGSVDGAGVTAAGQLSFAGSRIAGDLDLDCARLEAAGDRPALAADGASVDGSVTLTRVRARGEISLRAVRVGQRVRLQGAELDNPGAVACRLSRAQVAADVFAGGLTAAGELRLAGAAVGGDVLLERARLRNPGGTALNAITLRAVVLSLELAEPAQGLVDLRHASIAILRDDPAAWPDQLSLEGLTYQALEPRLPARQRLRWLARDPRGHQPQPYEQLAAHYNAIGQPAQAVSVLYARERSQRRALAPLARAWSRLQDLAVGYGYQPWRALVWLAVLLGAGSAVFALAPPPPLQAGVAPHFNAFVYTLDLLLPVVDLGQKHAFNPAGPEQWLSYVLIASGWILVTTIAAGAARVLSRR
jgi:hypothetical protein